MRFTLKCLFVLLLAVNVFPQVVVVFLPLYFVAIPGMVVSQVFAVHGTHGMFLSAGVIFLFAVCWVLFAWQDRILRHRPAILCLLCVVFGGMTWLLGQWIRLPEGIPDREGWSRSEVWAVTGSRMRTRQIGVGAAFISPRTCSEETAWLSESLRAWTHDRGGISQWEPLDGKSKAEHIFGDREDHERLEDFRRREAGRMKLQQIPREGFSYDGRGPDGRELKVWVFPSGAGSEIRYWCYRIVD